MTSPLHHEHTHLILTMIRPINVLHVHHSPLLPRLCGVGQTVAELLSILHIFLQVPFEIFYSHRYTNFSVSTQLAPFQPHFPCPSWYGTEAT